jgi:nicotinate-nucleotide adenylyltransferase
MKVGVMGGTFDPIHLGHLRAAENAREALGLDLVLLVPAGQPPHRPAALTAAGDRLAMVALATASNPAFAASDLEVLREGPSYTVDTLTHLHRERPGDEVFLIVGSDTYAEMTTWREPARLRELCTVAVVERPVEGGPAAALPEAAARVAHVRGPGLPISATDIRRRVHEGRSVRYLVADPVADYIARWRLFA